MVQLSQLIKRLLIIVSRPARLLECLVRLNTSIMYTPTYAHEILILKPVARCLLLLIDISVNLGL